MDVNLDVRTGLRSGLELIYENFINFDDELSATSAFDLESEL